MTEAEIQVIPLLALNMEKGDMSRGVQQPLEAGKGEKMDSPLEPPARNPPLPTR